MAATACGGTWWLAVPAGLALAAFSDAVSSICKAGGFGPSACGLAARWRSSMRQLHAPDARRYVRAASLASNTSVSAPRTAASSSQLPLRALAEGCTPAEMSGWPAHRSRKPDQTAKIRGSHVLPRLHCNRSDWPTGEKGTVTQKVPRRQGANGDGDLQLHA